MDILSREEFEEESDPQRRISHSMREDLYATIEVFAEALNLMVRGRGGPEYSPPVRALYDKGWLVSQETDDE